MKNQMKTNYNLEMYNLINSLDYKPRLLLHSCCGPCSTSVIEKLIKHFEITVYFYNPNIEPLEEYEKRKQNQLKVIKQNNINYIDSDYENELFTKTIEGHEQEKEGQSRCHKCYKLRIEKTKDLALKEKYEYFTTTLTVSPSKNSQIINQIGLSLENETLKWLPSDFKKEDGYLRSIKLSEEYNLYRQIYCGCQYSIVDNNTKN